MVHAREDYNRIQDPACMIGEDEPVLLFRAQDRHFTAVLTAYIELLFQDNSMPSKEFGEMSRLLKEHKRRAEEWQAVHGAKSPDL